jgi:hypothetical protein
VKQFYTVVAIAGLSANALACGTEPGAATATPPDDPRTVIASVAKGDPSFAAFGASESSTLAIESRVDGDHRVSRGRLVADLAATADGEQRFSLGDGPRFRVTLRLEDAAPVAAANDPKLAVFSEVLAATDLVASASNGAAELLLVLRDPSAPNRFSFAVEVGDGVGEPSFDPQGNLVFSSKEASSTPRELVIPAPIALDGMGVRHPGKMVYLPAENGNPARLIVSINHRELPHPVLLDPGVTVWRFRQVEAPSERWGHSSAFDERRRRVVTVGGGSSQSSYYTSTVEWDGSTLESFANRSTVNDGGTLGRGGFGMAYDRKRGRSIVFGGLRDGAHFDDLWQYDGNGWSPIVPTTAVRPSKRSLCTLAYDDSDGSYLVYGGADLSKIDQSNPLSILDALKVDTWRFADGVWTQKSTGSTVGAFGTSAAYDEVRKKVLTFGGAKIDGLAFNTTNDLAEWTGTSWKLVPTIGTKPAKRAFSSFVWDSTNKRFLVAGGADNIASVFGDVGSSGTSTFFSDLYALSDPESDGTYAWSRLPDLDGPIAAAGAAYDSARKQLVLYGGLLAPQVYSSALRLFDGTSWSRVTGTFPPARGDAAFAWEPGSKGLILFGGESGSSLLADTWRWDGRSWVTVPGAGGPARKEAAVTTTKDAVVVFGGRTESTFADNETWIFRNNKWTKSVVGPPPPGVNLSAMAYDPTRNVIVRFGGNDINGDATDQTWEFTEAAGWKKIVTVAAPPTEVGGAVFYDPKIGIVTVGGVNKVGLTTSTTWLYEPGAAGGARWSQIPTAGLPSRRQTVALAYDEARKATVMVAGRGDTVTDDFYTFDGKTWSNLAGVVTPRPSARDAHGLAYDPIHQQTILFGGRPSNNSLPYNDTWILQASGYGCTSDAECGEQFCTDGVCCGARECGACETCAGPGSLSGSCSAVGANLTDGKTCVGAKACDGLGSCKSGLGGVCKIDAECSSGVCVDGLCCDSRCQDGCRTCDAKKMAKQGKSGVCSDAKNWVCKKTCSNAQDCIAPDLCNAAGQCVPPVSVPNEDGCVVAPRSVGTSLLGVASAVGFVVGSIARRRRRRRGSAIPPT